VLTLSGAISRCLLLPNRLLRAWWGGGGAAPESLTLRLLLDGAPAGPEQACKLERRLRTSKAEQLLLWMERPLPLPLGAWLKTLQKVGPAALELTAAAAAPAPGTWSAARAAATAQAEAPAGEAGGGQQAGQQQAGATAARQYDGEEGSTMAECEVAAIACSGSEAGGGGPGMQRPAQPGGGQAALGSAAGQPPQPLPGAAAATASSGGPPVTPTALQALAGLQEIALPPPGTPEEEAALDVSAPFEAFAQVEAAARALGLGPAEVFALCDAVDARTRAPADARRFVRMELRLLWRACRAGAPGVPLARAWMARLLAAGAGAAAGSGEV
jgi:hypothetical protein